MDLLSQHEAFLRAIFDAPDDDTPRLVYADFLQENGEEDRAEFIRLGCALNRLANDDPNRVDLQADINTIVWKRTLRAGMPSWPWRPGVSLDRGFPLPALVVEVEGQDLQNLLWLREDTVHRKPEWYAAQAVKIRRTRIDVEMLNVLFAAPSFVRVVELDLSGEEVHDRSELGFDYATYHIEPVITTAAVAALAQHRGLRRIERLDLRNNDLDNDAARALVNSPYLDNLKRLQLLEGNRLRGRVWQQVIERFGEDVVG
jgi:uncharacterized protein (TIGR02996 family)